MDRPRSRNVPETPFGQRLRAARKMAGLSMEDLAAKIGGIVTKQAIGKYETGQMMPSPEVLEKLVEVLNAATWGASPLRPTEIDMLESERLESPPLLRIDGLPSPRFRRARLMSRLLKPHPESGSESIRPEPELHHAARPAMIEDVAAYSSLASRRARFLREWEEDASLNRIRFREGERLSAKTASALRYRIADHLGKYLELESILGQAARFENPIEGREAGTREEVEAAAREVRDRWELGAGPVVNLLGLLEDKGIKVCETRGIEGFEGLSGQLGPVPFVAVGMQNPPDRVRFTAAHELGHILCDFAPKEDPESECHAFGAAFLLPRAALEGAFRPSRRKVTMGDLSEIKETYGVSLQAIMYRAHGLGLVSDRQLRAFRETLKQKGWLIEEPVAYTGKERATRFRRLLHYAVTANILDPTRAAAMAGVSVEELEREIGEVF